MRLVVPTDFKILEAFSDGKRNNAVNIAVITGAKRQYVNTRLVMLEDYGLVDRIGPAEHSGIYAITDKGQCVLKHRDKYRSDDVDFDELLAQKNHS